jgi:uncharacterized protein
VADRSAVAAGLFESIRKGNAFAVDTSTGADPSLLRARDADSASVVVTALRSGHATLAEHLADRLLATTDGLDIFDAAAVGNVAEIRKLLAADRADVDDRGLDGYSPLHLAAEFGRLEAARLLLGRGADPNAVSMNELRATPLHSAISAGHRDTTSILLALGSSPNAIQRGGVSALHVAAHRGDEAIVDMLLLRGADATRKTDAGKTAADLADEINHAALARILRNAAKR